MITDADMAQVLEDAADLYLAEKVHWCQHSYVEDSQELTVCATTALGMAAGLGIWMPLAIDAAEGQVVRNSRAVLMGFIPDGYGHRIITEEETAWSRRAQALYLGAKDRVERELRARSNAEPEEYLPSEIPGFNDMEETTMDQVVDLFQSVAKDLRNKEEAR